MKVVGLPEFLRCMDQAAKSRRDQQTLQDFIRALADQHGKAEMRRASIVIQGTDIRLWATSPLNLSSASYRITWRHEDRSGDKVVVCFTLAET